jgi:hypothetical protein
MKKIHPKRLVKSGQNKDIYTYIYIYIYIYIYMGLRVDFAVLLTERKFSIIANIELVGALGFKFPVINGVCFYNFFPFHNFIGSGGVPFGVGVGGEGGRM